MKPATYRCPLSCPLRKKCFIIKTTAEIEFPLEALVKCAANNNKDIKVTIGGKERPP